jgi:hypothetical protein
MTNSSPAPTNEQASNHNLASTALLTLLLFIVFEMAQSLIALIYFLNLAVTYNTKSPYWSTYLAWQAVLMMAWLVTLLMVLRMKRATKNNTTVSTRRLIMPTGITLATTYAIKTGFLMFYLLTT